MIVFLIFTSIMLDVARELSLKLAAHPGTGSLRVISIGGRLIGSFDPVQAGWGAAGIFIWAMELIVWAKVLSYLPLNVAFPLASLAFAATPVAAKLLLGEHISARRWGGIALITAGAMMIGTMETGI